MGFGTFRPGASIQAQALGGALTGRAGGRGLGGGGTGGQKTPRLNLIDELLLGGAGLQPTDNFTYQRGNDTFNFGGGGNMTATRLPQTPTTPGPMVPGPTNAQLPKVPGRRPTGSGGVSRPRF